MRIKLKIWRQENAQAKGRMVDYELPEVNPEMSFLEMLDVLNEQLIRSGDTPIEFDHDCREGICGQCGLFINGRAHGPLSATTTCQLHMRHFKDGDTITIEPWRARAFPLVKDLVVDRSALDRVVQAGGFITARTGSAPDANEIPIGKEVADKSMDAAACIGCGACVAACPNGSAMLFTGAKVSHLNLLPQGKAEKDRRVVNMVKAMDENLFGNCTNYGECSAACPKEIKLDVIAKMNRDYGIATIRNFFSH